MTILCFLATKSAFYLIPFLLNLYTESEFIYGLRRLLLTNITPESVARVVSRTLFWGVLWRAKQAGAAGHWRGPGLSTAEIF